MFGLFKKSIKIYAPMTGDAVDISSTADPVFAGKMVGDGVTIRPIDGTVLSPVDGEITQLFDTGHALGFKVGDVEVLLHIGIDTVELKGEGFTKLAKVGDNVKVGDPLIKVDLEILKSNNKALDTPVIITSDAGKSIEKSLGSVEAGKTVIMELK